MNHSICVYAFIPRIGTRVLGTCRVLHACFRLKPRKTRFRKTSPRTFALSVSITDIVPHVTAKLMVSILCLSTRRLLRDLETCVSHHMYVLVFSATVFSVHGSLLSVPYLYGNILRSRGRIIMQLVVPDIYEVNTSSSLGHTMLISSGQCEDIDLVHVGVSSSLQGQRWLTSHISVISQATNYFVTVRSSITCPIYSDMSYLSLWLRCLGTNYIPYPSEFTLSSRG